MRKVQFILAASFILLAPRCPAAQTEYSFRVYGGYGRVSYGDFNDLVASNNEGLLPGNERFSEIRWIPEFAGEVLYSPLPRVRVGVGAGIIAGSSDVSNSILFGDDAIRYGYEHAVRAYPILATVYYDVPVPGTFVSPRIFAGAGAYYSRITFDVSLDPEPDPPFESIESELTTWGFGFHGGGGVYIPVTPKIAVELDVRFRFAVLAGYEGMSRSDERGEWDVFLARGTLPDGHVFYGPCSVDEGDSFDEGEVSLNGIGFSVGASISF